MKPTEDSNLAMSSMKDRNRKRSLTVGRNSWDGSADYHPPKRVKFETCGPHTEDVKTYERYIEVFRFQLDKPAMWWSKAEREDITEDCHDEIEAFRRDNVDQVRHFIRVFDHCQLAPSEASSDYLEKATISLPASIRGLEWGWAPSTISHRRTHIREVLAVQDQIRTLTPEMRDRVLSSRSLRSSRPGRVLARILGEGDERQCKTVNSTRGHRKQCRMMPSW
eukprot:CAMPEP_0176258800 /NCGR_PEP_ID=MMETSP0121_2-20121125/38747_1 /TAXON_ID=160619 /ORGANISM="Kryptoperidinium foliaceum, Strain CCMP 1326" /LENGTH=221 /DNA_ID=CAMNT_0017598677 /DNA_START=58 /DNA_END=723 /DNA_ORIENTATION=-